MLAEAAVEGGITLTGAQLIVVGTALVGAIGTLFGMLAKAWNDRVQAYREVIPVAQSLNEANKMLADLAFSLENKSQGLEPLIKNMKLIVEKQSESLAKLDSLATKAEVLYRVIKEKSNSEG